MATQDGEQVGSARNEILIAAERLFAQAGYDGTSVGDICAASGQNVGSVYWHFTNKAGLFDAVIKQGFTAYLDALPDPATMDGNPRENLRTYFESAGELIATRPAMFRIRLAMLALNEDKAPQAFESIRAAGEIISTSVQQVIRSAISDLDIADPERVSTEIATLIIDMTSGIIIRARWDAQVIRAGVQHLIYVVNLCLAGAEADERAGVDPAG